MKKILLILILPLLLSCQPLTQADVNRIIHGSPRLTTLDQFCTSLPRPDGFVFAYKKLGGNSDREHISYLYKSKLTFDEIKKFYLDYFEKNSWIRVHFWDESERFHTGFLEYKKENRTIGVEHVGFPNADYAVGCGEER